MVLVLTKQKGKPGHTGVTFETGTPATITVKQLKHAIALRDKVRLSCLSSSSHFVRCTEMDWMNRLQKTDSDSLPRTRSKFWTMTSKP